MEQIFEILKYILPASIVFATVYYMMKQYLASQYNLQYLQTQQANASSHVPIKLQAYERLILFLERIRLSNLLFRLRTTNMNVRDLSASLLISIQKEYEHNQAQQLYISNNLWDIITLAKQNSLNHISQISAQFQPEDDAGEFANALIKSEQEENKTGVSVAINAIKEEAKIILNTPS